MYLKQGCCNIMVVTVFQVIANMYTYAYIFILNVDLHDISVHI